MAKKGAPDTGTQYPGKYVSDKAKLKPGKTFGPKSPGGPGPASSKSNIGKGKK